MKKLSILLITLFFTSCLKEVDMEVEQIPHLLVVNCFFKEGKAFKVNVSRLAAYPDISDRSVPNALVTISADGMNAGTLPYVEKGNYSNPTIVPVPGKVYQITVDAPGYPQATASDSLPEPVPIDSVTYQANAGKYDDGIDYHQFQVWFRDIPGPNFYSIYILFTDAIDSILNYSPFEIFTTDPVISAEGITGEEFKDWFVFNDELFSNKSYCLKINVGDYYYNIGKIRALLISGTSTYYQYLKRLIKHSSYSYQDPFKPYNPVPLYSNVKNGLGIFAGYQGCTFDMDTPDLTHGE